CPVDWSWLPARSGSGSGTARRSAVHQFRVGGRGGLPAVHGENVCDGSQHGSEGNGRGDLMSIENRRQLENTRVKLQELEQLYTKTEQASSSDKHVRELTLRSLKKRINQFKEEISRFEARASEATRRG